jgi:hypothetical protein
MAHSGQSAGIHKGFTRALESRTLDAGFPGGGVVRRTCAVSLFVIGESALASLSFGVAAVPALVTFVAAGALMVRSSEL